MNLDPPSILRAIRVLEKHRSVMPRLERPIEPNPSAPWILGLASSPAIITPNRWLYTVTERGIDEPSGYESIGRPNGRTGYGINASEFNNSATHLRTHIPIDELPGTFDIYPLAGTFLWLPFRCVDGTLIWVTQEANVIHGTCEELP
jgi:hypothetical protein